MSVSASISKKQMKKKIKIIKKEYDDDGVDDSCDGAFRPKL